MSISIKILGTVILLAAVCTTPSFAMSDKQCPKQKEFCASVRCLPITEENCDGRIGKKSPCDCCFSCVPGPPKRIRPPYPSKCPDSCATVSCMFIEPVSCAQEGNTFVQNGGYCGCCDACNVELKLGEDCTQYDDYAVPPRCEAGTRCHPQTGVCT